MVKIFIYYSLTHNKTIVKYSNGVNFYEIGSINQFNQLLLQVIDVTDLQHFSYLDRIRNNIRYVKKINSIYDNKKKELDRERRHLVDAWKVNAFRRHCRK